MYFILRARNGRNVRIPESSFQTGPKDLTAGAQAFANGWMVVETFGRVTFCRGAKGELFGSRQSHCS